MALRVEQFQAKLQKALDRVRLVLHTNRAPVFAADVHHQYQDKYLLADSMTNAALASQVNALATLGLSPEQLATICEWSKTSAVSLRFRSEERCTFLREETRDVEDPTKRVLESSVSAVFTGTITSKRVTKVTEYFWKYETSYELIVVRGVGQQPDDRSSIVKRQGEVELKTSSNSSPYPAHQIPAAENEINVTWFVKQLQCESGSAVPQFAIDRAHSGCHTPRRNPEVDAAFQHFTSFSVWADQVSSYLSRLLRVQPADSTVKLDFSAISADSLFAPVLPLLEDKGKMALSSGATTSAASSSPAQETGSLLASLTGAADPVGNVLGVLDTNCFLADEARSLREKRDNLTKSFPSGNVVGTTAEACLAVTMMHCANVCNRWGQALDYIEDMIRKQLIAAIGKEVSPADFADYMTFHNRKLFADQYAPVPFCFAVRRSESHSPEGTVSLEQETVGGDSNIAAPIVTCVAHSSRDHKMEFPLSASANVSFGGDKYLHAWLSHRFSGQTGASLTLTSRARQFSSFMVLVGRISSARTFDPKYAAIVQNKDELEIPLDLSTIPTPKEFKDAIESLSPQQQAFAKAFRSMQLESTLFGILVVQIKPQLERVLNLPDDSLTKEIKLTQDLMQLFIKYQIPSDLLAFDPNRADGVQIVGHSAAMKLAAVKEHVRAMHDMIAQSQQEEVQQRRMEASYDQPLPPGPPLPPAPPSGFSFGAPMGMMMCDAVPQSMSLSMNAPMGGMGGGMFGGAPPPPPPMAASAPMLARSAGESAAPTPAPRPTPAPAPASAERQQQQQAGHSEESADLDAGGRDYTKVPKEMDESFERLDVDSQLRPTIINPSGSWAKRAQKALLASPTTTTLGSDGQKKEKDAAFDLLDALTKSGAVPIDHASLHIVVAATHCFDKTVTETVVQDNMNPIDKVERSTLIMASTVHQQPTSALIRDAQMPRVKATSPMLFLEEAAIDA